jgi:hypothetical protein
MKVLLGNKDALGWISWQEKLYEDFSSSSLLMSVLSHSSWGEGRQQNLS